MQGILRIAHCGGYHSVFDRLVTALNVVAKLLGHPIHWDTETVGCNPSMSSIPVTEQRSFVDALREIRSWMDLPEHAHEFLVLYLDDQIDLSLWVRPALGPQPLVCAGMNNWQDWAYGQTVFLAMHRC